MFRIHNIIILKVFTGSRVLFYDDSPLLGQFPGTWLPPLFPPDPPPEFPPDPPPPDPPPFPPEPPPEVSPFPPDPPPEEPLSPKYEIWETSLS